MTEEHYQEFDTCISRYDYEMEGGALQFSAAARALLDNSEIGAGVPRLRNWRGTWYWWHSGCYRTKSAEEVQGVLIRALGDQYRLSSSAISSLMAHLKAYAFLPASMHPPTWLREPPVDWQASDVLATRNQLIHLPSLLAGAARFAIEATPLFFATAALDFDIVHDAPPPRRWLEFLQQLWPDDPQSIELLQEWCGYVLTSDNRQQKALALIGPTRAGKGVICTVLTNLLGECNVEGPTLASLAMPFGLQKLLGKSLAIISDARLSSRADQQTIVERLLSVTGNDLITVQRKHTTDVTCRFALRLMYVSNELPKLFDSSGAVAGRLLLLRLRESFAGREDHTLTDRLLFELPSIFMWAIEGLRRLRQRGHFVQPSSGEAMVAALNALTSPVKSFVEERCVVRPDCRVEKARLFDAWQGWCERNGHKSGSSATFAKDLYAAFPQVGTARASYTGRPWLFTGIGISGDVVRHGQGHAQADSSSEAQCPSNGVIDVRAGE